MYRIHTGQNAHIAQTRTTHGWVYFRIRHVSCVYWRVCACARDLFVLVRARASHTVDAAATTAAAVERYSRRCFVVAATATTVTAAAAALSADLSTC